MGISDELHAFWFDRAVVRFGTRFDADVRRASHEAKDQGAADRAVDKTINRWLQTGPRQFRNPMAGKVSKQ